MDPASSLSKGKSQQAETELQALLRELGSDRVDAVKAPVDPRLLKLFEASPTQVLVHVVPHKCCVPLTGKAKGILCGKRPDHLTLEPRQVLSVSESHKWPRDLRETND